MRKIWPRSRVIHFFVQIAPSRLASPHAQITQVHPERDPHDRAAHLPVPPTTHLEPGHVEVVPIVELAPPLAAAKPAPETVTTALPSPRPTRAPPPAACPAHGRRREAPVPPETPPCKPPQHATPRATARAFARAAEVNVEVFSAAPGRAERLVLADRWVEKHDRRFIARWRWPWRLRWARIRRLMGGQFQLRNGLENAQIC